MKKEAPLLDRDQLRAFLAQKKLTPVKAAQEGRFIIPIPDFNDGGGPILMPNVKELAAKMRGSDGTVETIELEAGPQKIPADGTNVIVINRVDEFVQEALNRKLESLIISARGEFTRKVLNEFIGYARGYTYDGDTQKITFCRNVGFRNDVYNMTNGELKKRYVLASRQDISLEGFRDEKLRAGYYVKKPLEGMGAYIKGPFRSKIADSAGGTVQEFDKGAMVNVPDDPTMPITFIHVTDINACYTQRNGWPLVDENGQHNLPVFNAAETQEKKPNVARQHFARKHKP
jgi:hypothetical protein